MRVVFAGTPQAAVPSLVALDESRHQVAAVVTRPPAQQGRGRKLKESAVGVVARERDIAVLTPSDLTEAEFVEELQGLQPQCCPVVAYGRLLTRQLLALPPMGWVNLHFSLLPAWRGAAPVQQAILHGDDVTGATTFLLDEGLDTGSILGQITESVRTTDTAGTLLERLSVAGAALLVETLDRLEEGNVQGVPQPRDGISHAPKLSVEDARIRWDISALQVERLVRACNPAPGAWTTLAENRLKVLSALVVDEPAAPLKPGELLVSRDAVTVGCAFSAVTLVEVQPAGKRAMSAADWARGLGSTVGLMLD